MTPATARVAAAVAAWTATPDEKAGFAASEAEARRVAVHCVLTGTTPATTREWRR